MKIQLYLERTFLFEEADPNIKDPTKAIAGTNDIGETIAKSDPAVIKKVYEAYNGPIKDMQGEKGILGETYEFVKTKYNAEGGFITKIIDIVSNFMTIVKMGFKELAMWVAIKVSHYFVEFVDSIAKNATIQTHMKPLSDMLKKISNIFATPNPAKIIGLGFVVLGMITLIIFGIGGYIKDIAKMSGEEGGFKLSHMIRAIAGAIVGFPFMMICGFLMIIGGILAIMHGSKLTWNKEKGYLDADGKPIAVEPPKGMETSSAAETPTDTDTTPPSKSINWR